MATFVQMNQTPNNVRFYEESLLLLHPRILIEKSRCHRDDDGNFFIFPYYFSGYDTAILHTQNS